MRLFLTLFLSIFLNTHLFAEEEKPDAPPQDLPKPLFVSLGSYCDPARILRACELRTEAYPFDWIISFDGEALIQILNDDFDHFLNDSYFIPFGPVGHLLQSYYHLEFLHEGDFNHQFSSQLEKLKTKYQRRIDRFRNLKNYSGKLIFIREAFEFSANDPHRFYKFPENIEISDEYALRLYTALKAYFPEQNLTLIISNHHKKDEIEIEKIVSEQILFIRSNPSKDQESKTKNYSLFFSQLKS